MIADLSFREATIVAREIDGVFLSAVVDHGKESYLYRGLVEDRSFDDNGELDTIRLREAHRRLLSDDRTERIRPSTASMSKRTSGIVSFGVIYF